ncbi:MAG: energy transducer TonB [Sphingobacteriales bacterium]|nr:energy transducer TonB [Sphingobacteriales bacterium]
MITNLVLIYILQIFTLFNSDHPRFKGGERALALFVSHNLIYPEYSRQNCLHGTVNVSFKLNRKGQVFDSHVTKGFGIDLDDEALRIIRLTSGKWVVPSSHDTTDYLVLPVNFSLKMVECERNSPENFQKAIAAYKAQQSLSFAIFNFYEKKAKGEYNPWEEGRIIALKSQLGYDERYINQLLKQANRKLKQGDPESACDDYLTIRRLGSSKADKFIEENCH